MTTLARHSPSANAEKSPRSKRVLFFAITVSIPLLLFLGLEAGLRMLHYDSDLDLVIEKEVNGQKTYAINRSVARRYFAYSGTVIPEPADNTFVMKKPKNTKRIFCLGESTMAGFPYEFNATAPSCLQDRLKAEFPQYNFEVINVGLSAISSFVVVDFMRDLVNYEPDLFIVYLGHNEFYGIYGSGSSIQVPGGYWITRLSISMLRYKTFLLMRDSYSWIKQKLFTSPSRIKGTLMEQMVGNQYISYESPEYISTLNNYEQNLRAIIDAAESIHTPIVFSSLVSNLKDQPPFHAMFSPSPNAETKLRWESLIAHGDSLFRIQEFKSASESYERCMQLDTMNAAAFFKLGQTQYELGEYGSALQSFMLARDRDGLRFRASEDFEQALVSMCAHRGVILAGTDSAFAANSGHRIIGKTLILEHLHPNIDGYFLMGKVFAETIRNNHLLLDSPTWDSAKTFSDDYYRSISGVTAFDYALGAIKVSYLTHEWPFVTVDQEFTYTPTTNVESIVSDYIHEKTIWSTARYDLAIYYAQNHNYSGARAECYAVSKVIPFSYQPLLRIADYYQMEGQRDSAASAYEVCYEREDNPYARVKLAVVLLQEEHPAEASQQIEAALALAMRKGITLSGKEQAFSYYLLGVANAKLGKFELAREYANHSLVADPMFAEAKSLLSQLDSIRKH